MTRKVVGVWYSLYCIHRWQQTTTVIASLADSGPKFKDVSGSVNSQDVGVYGWFRSSNMSPSTQKLLSFPPPLWGFGFFTLALSSQSSNARCKGDRRSQVREAALGLTDTPISTPSFQKGRERNYPAKESQKAMIHLYSSLSILLRLDILWLGINLVFSGQGLREIPHDVYLPQIPTLTFTSWYLSLILSR